MGTILGHLGSDVVFGGPGVGFSLIFGCLGGHFGVVFLIVSDFLMSKWELRLWTSFLVHFRWKKDFKTVALCC